MFSFSCNNFLLIEEGVEDFLFFFILVSRPLVTFFLTLLLTQNLNHIDKTPISRAYKTTARDAFGSDNMLQQILFSAGYRSSPTRNRELL